MSEYDFEPLVKEYRGQTHAIEILDGIVASGKSGSSVPIRSVFDRPLPADDSEAWRK